jgi:hypothetical protein
VRPRTVFISWETEITLHAFTGVITDTMCGARRGIMNNQPDDQCVKMRTRGEADYALSDGKSVIKLSDQQTPAKYAA